MTIHGIEEFLINMNFTIEIYQLNPQEMSHFSVQTKLISNKWRPPSLSELTPMIFNTELTHLDSEASK